MVTGGVDVLVGVGVAVVSVGRYVLTEMTAGDDLRSNVYMNHLPTSSSLKVAGVASSLKIPKV